MTTETLITAEQLFSMPDDDTRWDLIRGEVWRMSLPDAKHGKLAMRVGRLLSNFVEDHGLGEVAAAETGFLLARDPDTVIGPNAAFVQTARVPAEGVPDWYWPLAPDLAVEIFFPGDRAGKMAAKVQAYLDAGVRLVWVLYPSRQQVVEHAPGVPARTLSDDDVLDGGLVAPGSQCALPLLWR